MLMAMVKNVRTHVLWSNNIFLLRCLKTNKPSTLINRFLLYLQCYLGMAINFERFELIAFAAINSLLSKLADVRSDA